MTDIETGLEHEGAPSVPGCWLCHDLMCFGKKRQQQRCNNNEHPPNQDRKMMMMWTRERERDDNEGPQRPQPNTTAANVWIKIS